MSVTKHSLASSLVFALGMASVAIAADSPEIIMLRSKAVRGNPVAQYNLARVFADPNSVNFDKAEAFVWFQLAAENGATGNDLAKLVDRMSPKELDDAKTRLADRRGLLGSSKPAASPAAGADESVEKLKAERDQLVASLNAATSELAALRATTPKTGSDQAKAEIDRLGNELNETRAAAREMAAKSQQLEDIASERGRALQQVQNELNQLKNTPGSASAALEAKYNALSTDRDLLVKQLADAQEQARKIKELPDRVARAERDVELLRAQNAKLTNALRVAEEQVKLAANAPQPLAAPAARQDEVKVLEEKLARAERGVTQLNKKNLELADLAQRAYSAQNELEKVQARSAADQKKIQDLGAKVTQLTSTNESLRQGALTAKNAAADIATLKEQLGLVEKQRVAADERAAAAEAKLAAIPPAPSAASLAETDALQKQLEETKEKLTVALRSFATQQKELEDARSATTSAQTALENERLTRSSGSKEAEAIIASVREKIATLEQQNASLVERANSAEAKLSAVNSNSGDSQQELNDAKDKLSTALRSFTILQKELDETKDKLTAALADAESQRTQLSAATGESKERVNALNAIQQEINQLRGTSITQNKESLMLRDQLRQVLSQIASLSEENAQLKTKIALLAPPPSSTLASPLRPNTAAAQVAITLPSSLLAKPTVAPAAAEKRTHVIGDGDSLIKIARRYYGNSDRWNDIYQANRSILSDPNRLPKGASLVIP